MLGPAASFCRRSGVYLHQLWMVYLSYGVLGGIGLGIGYISPVSTLIRWFPDRPGMATGMAIMGFGGGAFIASPLSVWLMSRFSTPTHVGVAETFIAYNVTHGVAPAQAYNVTMYVMAGLLVVGFICNLVVKPVHERFHMRAAEAEDEVAAAPVFGSE